MLRHPLASSGHAEFSDGEFNSVVEQKGLGSKPEKVERVILCTGKISIDLLERIQQREEEDWDWLHILRVEELYPFPRRIIREILARFASLKEVTWVQEEPKNMGAWPFMESRIREITPKDVPLSYIGRTYRSSPAEGSPIAHKTEQERIVSESLTRKN